MKKFVLVFSFLAAACAAAPAWAYLGGFEQADGYTLGFISQGINPASQYTDVTYYNAGQSGANAGGGIPTSVAPDSGLWELLTQPGAFFRTAAVRAGYTGAAPPYGALPAPLSGDGVPAYIVGDHFGGHTGQALALRNETPAVGGPIGGPMEYDYTLDSFDFGGIAPASVTSGTQTVSFFFKPNPAAPPNPAGLAQDRFIMTFHDSAANIGLQIGYTDANEVIWRDDPSNAWNATAIIADSAPVNWDQFIVKLDLTNDTFAIDYFSEATSLTTNLAPVGTPMGNAMLDFTHLDWWLVDQTTGGIGGKNFFDDFHFNVVPEPSSVVLLVMGGLGLIAGGKRLQRKKAS